MHVYMQDSLIFGYTNIDIQHIMHMYEQDSYSNAMIGGTNYVNRIRNKDFILRNIAGESILVATGSATQDFNGMITLNEVATFILENIDECETEEVVVEKVLEEFEIDEETARSDVREFLDQAIKFGIII